jgi:hypothetical protein
LYLRRTVNGCDESIAAPRDSLDKSWVVGIITQGFPEFANGHAEGGIKLNKGVGGPQPLADAFSCDNLSGVLKQKKQ